MANHQEDNKNKYQNGMADNKDNKPAKTKSFPIICIGGSAGAFQAMEKLFAHMPADSGMAFIVVMHLDKNHVGSVAELLQNFTSLPVTEAEDGQPVKPDRVYLIPPNKDMGIHNGKLLLMAPSRFNGYRLPVDHFLQSLAEDQWNRAVAIILSGMGSDGETGIRMIKEKLGMVMVQDPESAQYDSMPQSAIATNLVDYVLAPEEMPIKLIQYLKHPAMADELNDELKNQNRDATAIQKVLMLLRTQTGHDFSQYKKNTITRRIDRRLAFHQLPDYTHYIAFLRENPQEIDVLFNELLIGVTKFFRDAAAFDVLKEKLYGLLRVKADNEPVRIWVVGCSTGEEAYSIAILIMECFSSIGGAKTPKVQIFATDLDEAAIEHARTGLYLDNIAADISPERLGRYFVKKEKGYQVTKDLREMIVFAQHNLIKDAPFTRLDLLTCRNVMIYLNAELQAKIIPVFHYSLNARGVLFLGPAETLGGFSEMFSAIDPKWKIYERRDGAPIMSKMVDFPFNISKQALHLYRVDEPEKPIKKKTLAETFSKILLENYTPASVLINGKGDILYINGRTGKFLELNAGEVTMNINEMAKDDLKYPLSNAIHQAGSQKDTINVNGIRLTEDGKVRLVDLKVSQLQNNALQGLLLVVFDDKGLLTKTERRKKYKGPEHNEAVEELEKELVYTKQQLRNTVEQMETSLEELKSTNEELQSTNEELQSTNEESLTTKEEMQSLNEELMTINVQYQSKAEELTQLNNDMKNMLDSTEIGTIFLDINMIILRFTPQVKKLFNVITTDIGRSINDIVFNFQYASLETDIHHVIETLAVKEVEVKTKKDEWYRLRMMPYRTLDNFINGVVLTFTKVTELKAIEFKFETLNRYVKSMLTVLTTPALLLDKDLNIISSNEAYVSFFKISSIKEMIGLSLNILVHEFWKTSKLDKFLKQCTNQETKITFTNDFLVIGTKTITITSKPSVNEIDGETLMTMIVIEE
ncbi:chemotaxis protein CheB [Mucilaginibacter sp. PAMB04274]|uniref:chemotaxis protein CheB n=1 Tax=Mucilaginibacter sp. PAMB04274 TaxID=3138568 RepID=UPI0031F5FB8E